MRLFLAARVCFQSSRVLLASFVSLASVGLGCTLCVCGIGSCVVESGAEGGRWRQRAAACGLAWLASNVCFRRCASRPALWATPHRLTSPRLTSPHPHPRLALAALTLTTPHHRPIALGVILLLSPVSIVSYSLLASSLFRILNPLPSLRRELALPALPAARLAPLSSKFTAQRLLR